ncbi:vaccinia C4L/C10L-like protein [Magpiepox virus 2]|nr:vaccinia C4L/C10L-like protein [Magpiepox virus 2]
MPIYSEFNKILCKLCCKNNIRNIKFRGLFNYSDDIYCLYIDTILTYPRN